MAVSVTFKINGQDVTPFAGWHAASIVVQRDVERLTLACELQKVKLVGDAAAVVNNSFSLTLGIPVELNVNGIVLRGRIFHGNIYYAKRYVIISAHLDTGGLFARLVEGKLIQENWRQDVKVLVAPRVDKATVLMLAVMSFMLIYLTIRETLDLIKDIATGVGVAGAGVSGPISSAIMMIVINILRIIYIAAMVLALINIIKQIKDLLQRTITVRAFRLGYVLEQIAQSAGFSIGQMPSWLHDVWIVGGGIEQYEAGELFRLAKQISRSVLFVNNNELKLISINSVFPSNYRVAHEETYRHNLDEMKRRTLISLVRDVSDEHTRGAVVAAEIDRSGLVGLERIDVPYAPATRAGQTEALKALKAFATVLKTFGGVFGNVSMQIKNLEDLLIVEREQFLPKLIYSQAVPNKIAKGTDKNTVKQIAASYLNVMPRRVYESVKMPLSAQAFNSLMAAGFPGVRSLKWRFADGVAEVDYETPESLFNLTENVNYV